MKSINEVVDKMWFVSNLNRVNKDKAKRVFNMMLLPLRYSESTEFKPIIFGRKAIEFNVDYLIPESKFLKEEGKTLRNFASYLQGIRVKSKTRLCSIKLFVNGIYNTYINEADNFIHLYCGWLSNPYHVIR